ncbi:MAG: hypothetical protein JWO44_1238 [Bacteroidetes bacterium]|nr:hypothetical protein [Bacteroidota bacterium]
MILLQNTIACDTLALSIHDKFSQYFTFSDDLVKLSEQVNDTTLKLLAAIVLLLLGTEKLKPIRSKFKYIYFILLPALICLVYSFYLGARLHEHSAKLKLFRHFEEVKYLVDGEYNESFTKLYIAQNYFMRWGGGLMAVWLLLYFVWWFYAPDKTFKQKIKNNKKQPQA